MALRLEQSVIANRFGSNARCRVNYRNQKRKIEATLARVDWKRCVALTVLFDEPRWYWVDGDHAKRDGVRVVVLPNKSKRRPAGQKGPHN